MGQKASSVVRVLSLSCDDPRAHRSQTNLNSTMWPFHANLPRQLNPKDKIIIEGVISSDAETFSISLVADHDLSQSPDNVPYHHKIIFSENIAVYNSKFNNSWQEENIVEDVSLEKSTFQIKLVIKENEIITYYNDVYQNIYAIQNLSIEDIKYLQIWEGIECVNSMTVEFGRD